MLQAEIDHVKQIALNIGRELTAGIREDLQKIIDDKIEAARADIMSRMKKDLDSAVADLQSAKIEIKTTPEPAAPKKAAGRAKKGGS